MNYSEFQLANYNTKEHPTWAKRCSFVKEEVGNSLLMQLILMFPNQMGSFVWPCQPNRWQKNVHDNGIQHFSSNIIPGIIFYLRN